MSLEALVAEIAIKKTESGERLRVILRDYRGYLGTAYIRGYQHTHSTKNLTPEQKDAVLKFLEKLKQENPQIPFEVKCPDRVKKHNIVQATGIFELKELLPEEFPRGNYTKQARWSFCPEGSVVTIDEMLVKCFDMQGELNLTLEELRAELGKEIESKAAATRLYKKIISKNKVPEQYSEKAKDISEKLEQMNSVLKEFGGSAYINAKDNFAEIEVDTPSRFKFQRMMHYLELLNSRWMFIDTEKPLFDTPQEEISWAGITYFSKGDYQKEIHSLHSTGTKSVNGYKIIVHNTQEELVSAVRDLIKHEDPERISAYNAKYDCDELRKAGDMRGAGVRNSRPRFVSSTKFFESIGISGRFVTDLLAWAKVQYRHLMHRKLEIISGEIFGDEEFEKSINYEQMAELERICKDEAKTKEEREAAGLTIAGYLSADVDILLKIKQSEVFKESMKAYSKISAILNLSFEKLMRGTNSVTEAMEKEYFEKVGNHRQNSFFSYKEMINSQNRARARIKSLFKKYLGAGEQTGIAEDVTLAYIPQYIFFRNYVNHPERFPLIDIMAFETDKTNSNLAKFIMVQHTDALCKFVSTDFAEYKSTERLARTAFKKAKTAKKKFAKVYNVMPRTYLRFKSEFEKITSGKYGKDAIAKAKRKMGTFMDENSGALFGNQELAEDFVSAYCEYLALKTRMKSIRTRMRGNYLIKNPDEIDQSLQSGLERIASNLNAKGCKIVAQFGQFVYIKGDAENIDGVIPLKKIPRLLYTDKMYYSDHGFTRTFKKDRKATNNRTVFEIDCLKEFIGRAMRGEYFEALKGIRERCRILESYNPENPSDFFAKTGYLNEDFLLYTKSSKRFEGIQDNEKISFFETDEYAAKIAEKVHTENGRKFFTEKKCEKEKKHYIMGVSEYRPDIQRFATDYVFRWRDVIGDLIGHENAYKLLSENVEDSWIKEMAEKISPL